MKHIILFSISLVFSVTVSADIPSTDSKGFITREHALHCIQMNRDIIESQQHLTRFETRKVTLKSKIDYLHNQIELRREKIAELDRQHDQQNNKNYNQLIDQFENLVDERKQTVALYNSENQNHLSHAKDDVNLQNTYTEQCINQVQISEKLHKDVCLNSTSLWCSLFKFTPQ